jgi:hypothetical protein
MEYFILDQGQAKRERLSAEAQHEALLQEARKAQARRGHELKPALWLKPVQKFNWLGLLIRLSLLLGFVRTLV